MQISVLSDEISELGREFLMSALKVINSGALFLFRVKKLSLTIVFLSLLIFTFFRSNVFLGNKLYPLSSNKKVQIVDNEICLKFI